MTDDPAAVIAELYRRFSAGEFAEAAELATEEVEWIPDRRVGIAPLRGRDAVMGFFRERAEMFDEFSTEVDELQAVGETVLAMLHVRGRGHASGAEFEIRIGHVWEVRGGRVVRGRGFGDRDEARQAAGF